VLCRRAEAASQAQLPTLEREHTAKSPLRVIAPTLLAVSVLAGLALLAGHLSSNGEPRLEALVELASAVPAPARLAKPVPAARPTSAAVVAKSTEPHDAVEPELQQPGLAQPGLERPGLEQPELQPAFNPQPADQAARSAEDERRHQEVMAAIAARELQRAAAGVAITMYSTSWCGACNAARDHMRAHGIAFTDRNVEEDPEAKAQQLQLNPRGSVPTIDVDGREVLVGFSASHLKAAIARSVARRTGS
jgi:glutaredoxin